MKMIATIGVTANVPNFRIAQDDITNKNQIRSTVQIKLQAEKAAKEIKEDIKENKGLMSKPIKGESE
jgi:hypothetical protein